MTWWVLQFSRCGPARYLSHLDTARAVQRTFARAGVPVVLSRGLRPKPRLSLPLPLPVGAAGRAELGVLEVPDGVEGQAALARLRAAAPPGLVPVAIVASGERHPRPRAAEAVYACVVEGDAGAIQAAVERYCKGVSVVRERVSPKGRRSLDLKEYIGGAVTEPVAGGARVRFAVRYHNDGSARPQEFVDLIAEWAGVDPAMHSLERESIVWQGLPWGSCPGAGRSGS